MCLPLGWSIQADELREGPQTFVAAGLRFSFLVVQTHLQIGSEQDLSDHREVARTNMLLGFDDSVLGRTLRYQSGFYDAARNFNLLSGDASFRVDFGLCRPKTTCPVLHSTNPLDWKDSSS
eukprot:s24_g55.t1